MKTSKALECNQKGKCFARSNRGYCSILEGDPYDAGKCPFQKPLREVTNDVYFPINDNYVDPSVKVS